MVPVSTFRSLVDGISDPFESLVCKFFYETGARVNEGCSEDFASFYKLRPGQGKRRQKRRQIARTRAVGPEFEDVGFDIFEGEVVLTIRLQVLKRKEKTGRPFMRTVGLPRSPKYDPWVEDIANYTKSLGVKQPLLPIDSNTANRIMQKHGIYDLVKADRRFDGKIENPLRHIRTDHLIGFYHFQPMEELIFMGRKLSTGLAGFGVSSVIDDYQSQGWAFYFPRLLKPVRLEEKRDEITDGSVDDKRKAVMKYVPISNTDI